MKYETLEKFSLMLVSYAQQNYSLCLDQIDELTRNEDIPMGTRNDLSQLWRHLNDREYYTALGYLTAVNKQIWDKFKGVERFG